MRFVLKKLKSSGGASMLMALLLLLIVAMVSSVVISAAASSVFNLSTAQAQQQAYLTTQSPAMLMRGAMRSNQWSYKKVTKGTEYSSNGSNWSFTPEGDPTVTKPDEGVIFGKFIGDAVESVVEYNIPYTQSYTISVPGYDDVSAELTFAPMVEDETGHPYYQLRAVLSLASDIEQNSEKSAPFRLVYTAKAIMNEDRKVGTEDWNGTRGKKRAVELTQQLVWDTETDKIEKG